jgi:hypothetical protein
MGHVVIGFSLSFIGYKLLEAVETDNCLFFYQFDGVEAITSCFQECGFFNPLLWFYCNTLHIDLILIQQPKHRLTGAGASHLPAFLGNL